MWVCGCAGVQVWVGRWGKERGWRGVGRGGKGVDWGGEEVDGEVCGKEVCRAVGVYLSSHTEGLGLSKCIKSCMPKHC